MRFHLLLAVSSLLAVPVWAARWDVIPGISVGETYTDNVSLSADTDKRDDWITQVVPGISVSAESDRVRFDANYAPEFTYYALGEHENQIFQRGAASGKVEFVDQLIFMDFGARVDQYDVSLSGPITVSNVNDTGNRATVASYSISPYLRHNFSTYAELEARFTASAVNSDREDTLSDSVSDRVDLRLQSGPTYKLLTWGVDYFKERISYDNTNDDSVSESITGKAVRLITPTTGLIAKAGYESYDMGGLSPTSEGALWALGAEWTPNLRTRFEATAGRRFYGDAYTLDLSHRTRLTTLGVQYDEYVSSTRSELLVPSGTNTSGYLDTLFSSQFPDPVARKKAVDDFIARTGLPPELATSVNFFDDELFLAKRWQASAGILGVRNVVIGNIYKERRKSLNGNSIFPTGDDLLGSDSVGQTGVSLQWNLRIDGKTALNAGGSYSRNEFSGTSRADELTYVGMGLTRQLQPRVFASLNYRRQQNDSNSTTGSYTENAVFATIQNRFR